MARKSDTESPVAARAALDQRQQSGDDADKRLEEQASEQERTQKEELSRGAKAKAGAHQKFIDDDNVAAARSSSGFSGAGAQNGFVDQVSRRSARDVMEGHFARLDLNADGVQDALKQVAGLTDADGDLVEDVDYGVYVGPAELDEKTGYPQSAFFRLRGRNAPATVVVPYEALRPASAGAA